VIIPVYLRNLLISLICDLIRDYFCKKLTMRPASIIFILFMTLSSCREQAKQTMPEKKPVPGRYSAGFSQGIQNLLSGYYQLSESLVNWDSTHADAQASTLIQSLDTTSLDELKKDSLVHQTALTYIPQLKTNLAAMRSAADITGKRKAFNAVTENFYDLLRSIRYDRATIYLEECTMPYNDTGSGLWLSRTNIGDSIRNPYLGLHHPRYGKGMLTCSEVKDSVHFIDSK
jgi:hypothetical protein